MFTMKQSQAGNILSILDAAARDFLVERTTTGWRVETEQTEGVEGYSCEGVSLADCLGQVAQVLACELALEPEDEGVPPAPLWDGDGADARIAFAVEPVVEFCTPIDPYANVTEHLKAWEETNGIPVVVVFG